MITLRSFMDYSEIVALCNLLEQYHKPGMIIAEIGVAEGGTTVFISAYLAEYGVTIFAIDVWAEEGQYGNFLKITRDWIDIKRIFPLKMSSVDASKIFSDNLFDFVFIDADHKYSSVSQDIRAWLPKIKIGGILSGHDCEKHYLDYDEKQRAEIDANVESDKTSFDCHAGVVRALYDIFNDDYKICPRSTIWYKVKDA